VKKFIRHFSGSIVPVKKEIERAALMSNVIENFIFLELQYFIDYF